MGDSSFSSQEAEAPIIFGEVMRETWGSPRLRDWTPLRDLAAALEPPDEEEEDVVAFLSQEIGMEVDEVEEELYSLARQAMHIGHEDPVR